MVSIEHTDPVNARILSISEDKIAGFVRDPFAEIARQCRTAARNRARAHSRHARSRNHPPRPPDAACDQPRLRRARRLEGSAGKAGRGLRFHVPGGSLFRTCRDPLDGRQNPGRGLQALDDSEGAGRILARCALPGCSAGGRARKPTVSCRPRESSPWESATCGARRSTLATRRSEPAKMHVVETITLSDHEWRMLDSPKARVYARRNSGTRLGGARGRGRCLRWRSSSRSPNRWRLASSSADSRPSSNTSNPARAGTRVTRFNGLFHWAVPRGREIEAGGEIGRHEILTHCYWREGGPEFNNVNIMAVAHGTEKDRLLEHKAAIDRHLESVGIPVSYTNVFWGGRSEIKPSEISPLAYREWLARLRRRTSLTNRAQPGAKVCTADLAPRIQRNFFKEKPASWHLPCRQIPRTKRPQFRFGRVALRRRPRPPRLARSPASRARPPRGPR